MLAQTMLKAVPTSVAEWLARVTASGERQLAVGQADSLLAEGLFAEALRDPSNLELDWIWLAGLVTRAAERRYCIERALHINPHSQAARRLLASCEQRRAGDRPAEETCDLVDRG